MIQLQITAGRQAGQEMVVHRFPILIGSGADADLRIDDAGVWQRHLKITFDPENGFRYSAGSGASVLIHGEVSEGGLLRNGDEIGLGSARLRFWLARSRQMRFTGMEVALWLFLSALFIIQLGLIYWLLS